MAKTAKPVTPKPPPIISNPENEKGFYSNHIQVSLTNTEMIIDFYIIGPDLTFPTPELSTSSQKGKIIHLQRAITPLSHAKGLASAIANVVAEHEADHQEELPNSRAHSPDDKMTIWPEK